MRKYAVSFAIFAFFAAGVSGASCDFRTLLDKAQKEIFSAVPRTQGSDEYVQQLLLPGGETVDLEPSMDFADREIPFIIADTETCEVKAVTEERRIVEGRLTDFLNGYLHLSQRAYGRIHNDFNTQTETGNPHTVAILDYWKFYSRDGGVTYVPYSPDLYRLFPNLAEEGRAHFRRDEEEALAWLLKAGLITEENAAFYREFLPRIFLSESVDPFEFKISDPETRTRLAEQPYVTLGANGDKAYVLKVSSAGAKGPMQIWYKSCIDIRNLYPKAMLSENCNGAEWGSHSHVGNIAAAVLEMEMHKATLVRLLGEDILSRPDLQRILAASYNGGPGWVVRSYRAYGDNWGKAHFRKIKIVVRRKGKKVKVSRTERVGLRGETVDYLFKYDHLSLPANSPTFTAYGAAK